MSGNIVGNGDEVDIGLPTGHQFESIGSGIKQLGTAFMHGGLGTHVGYGVGVTGEGWTDGCGTTDGTGGGDGIVIGEGFDEG